jgi:3-deoxy-D-manno-octulosonic-acid transferase
VLRGLYSLGWILGVPAALAYLLYRSFRQPAYRLHWKERFGHGEAPPPGRRQIWIHAVSVGETVAAASLIRRLAARDPDSLLLLTHATPTGRATGSELFRDLGPRLRQCYLPYDLPFAVNRFLDRQRPSCGLIMETEVWPNLMHAARTRAVPMAVINARLSEKSLARGLKYRRLIAPAIEAFDLIVAQSAADSARMSRLARPADAVAGNLKFDQAISEAAREAGAAWRSRLAPLRVIVAASTRDGEEALILQHWGSRRAVPNARTPSADSPDDAPTAKAAGARHPTLMRPPPRRSVLRRLTQLTGYRPWKPCWSSCPVIPIASRRWRR